MIKNGFCKKKKRAFKEKSALAQSVFEQERLCMHFSNVVDACLSQKCAISSPARLVFISDCYLLLILKARTASESSLTSFSEVFAISFMLFDVDERAFDAEEQDCIPLSTSLCIWFSVSQFWETCSVLPVMTSTLFLTATELVRMSLSADKMP